MKITKKTVRRIVLFAAAGILAVCAAGYGASWFIGARLARTLKESYGLDTTIGKVRIGFPNRLVIDSLTVYDPRQDSRTAVFSASRLSCSFFLWPFQRSPVIIIPRVVLFSPSVRVDIRTDGRGGEAWQKFLSRAPSSSDGRPACIVRGLLVRDGAVTINDERSGPLVQRIIKNISLECLAKSRDSLSFRVDAEYLSAARTVGVRAEGSCDFSARRATVRLGCAGIEIAELLRYAGHWVPPDIRVRSGIIDKADLDVSLDGRCLSVFGSVEASALQIRRHGLQAQGGAVIRPVFSYDWETKKFSGSATVACRQVSLTGVPYVGYIDELNGEVTIDSRSLVAQELHCSILGAPSVVSGSVEDFSSPRVSLVARSRGLALEKLAALFPGAFRGVALSGSASAQVVLEGPLSSVASGLSARFDLHDAAIRPDWSRVALTSVEGSVLATSEGVQWKLVSFRYGDTACISSGQLRGYRHSSVDFTVESDKGVLAADLEIEGSHVAIKNFKGTFRDSNFDIEGEIDGSDMSRPLVSLRGATQVSLGDVRGLLPDALKKTAEKYAFAGRLGIMGTFNGRLSEPASWQLACAASSGTLEVAGIKLSDVSFSASQSDGKFSLSSFTATGYSGQWEGQASIDFNGTAPEYVLKSTVRDVSLSLLKGDVAGLSSRDIDGSLCLRVELKGPLSDVTLCTGSAAVLVTEGRLWELTFFKRLGELLLFSGYNTIVFREARGEFSIGGGRITTQNTRFSSDRLILSCRGTVGFDGGLAANVYIRANRALLKDPMNVRNFASFLFGELGSLVAVEAGGSLEEPRYTLVPVPIDILKNLKSVFSGEYKGFPFLF